MTERTCSEPDCGRRATAKGLCDTHYTAKKRREETRPCTFAGCDRKQRSKGLCKGHYEMAGRGEELRPLRPKRPEKCTYPGCDRKHEAKDLCGSHYNQQNSGRPLQAIDPRAERGEGVAWIAANTTNPGSECILFPWQPDQRQPMISLGGRSQSVGAVSLQLNGSARPYGQHVRHDPAVCNNPRCVNPRHLTWGTRIENMADKKIAGTDRWPSDRVEFRKLTADDVQEIRRLIDEGELTQHEIGARFGVQGNCVSSIKTGRLWSWLDPPSGVV